MSSTILFSPGAVLFFPFCHVATSPAGKNPSGFPSAMWPRAALMPVILLLPPEEKLSTGKTVYAPEMMVGDSEEPSFAGNELQLL